MKFAVIASVLSLLSPIHAHASVDTLQAGLAAIEIQVPAGTPLGGYGDAPRRASLKKIDLKRHSPSALFTPSEGVLDPIRSKALIIRKGDRKLLFISLDVVAVSDEFHDDLIKHLAASGFNQNEVFVSAVHTHSGPGALTKNLFWGAVAMDLYKKPAYDAFLDSVLKSVAQATKNLENASINYTSFEVDGIQNNRRGHGDMIDKTARLLWVKDTEGRVMGALANFAIHGTAMDETNLKFSSDVPGGIERALESKIADKNLDTGKQGQTSNPPIVLFVNSAEADISPSYVGQSGIELIGSIFSTEAITHTDDGVRLPEDWSVTTTKVYFPPFLNIYNCIAPEKEPAKHGIQRLTNILGIPVPEFFPLSTPLWAINWGPVRMMTWPGEATEELGQQLRTTAMNTGAQDAMVLGLTNAHLGYFLTPEDYQEGGYETCVDLYGPQGGERIVGAYQKLFH